MRKQEQMTETAKQTDENSTRKLLVVFIVGFATVLIGLIVMVVAAAESGSVSSGGIIFIGPIPIVFGSGPGSQWLVLFVIILAVLTITMFLILSRRPTVTRV